MFENLHQAMQRQALLVTLCNDILATYFPAGDVNFDTRLYVDNFISHNEKFFREDRLINQWLALLDSSARNNDDQTSVTDYSTKSVVTTEKNDQKAKTTE